MIIVSPTVEHSGTHFVIRLLNQFKHVQPHQGANPDRDTLVQTHFGHKWWDEFEKIVEKHDPPIIIPLRKLHSIVISWERRGKNLRTLSDRLDLLMEYDEKDPYYLPIDADDRQDYLDDINYYLDLNLETDWPIVGSEKKSAGKPESIIQNWKDYEYLKDRHGEFFKSIYGRI